MNKKKLLAYLIFAMVFSWSFKVHSQGNQDIIVSVNKPIAEVQPTMWGIFFEDINFGADGGIYAELIKNRSAPDYFQTFGLGFFEYFQLAKDMGAEPVPILNCGMACQFNTAEAVWLSDLDPYVQDALDLIEFANGEVNTTWGKVRASLGHPGPFNLKILGIGNENWGPQYIDRLKIFEKAIKDKYPDIKLVASSGTDPDGERFDYLNNEIRKLGVDLIGFEFSMPLMGWTVSKNYFNEGAVLVLNTQGDNAANPRFVRITKNNVDDSLSLTNEGFRGMGIKKGLRYDFSVLCRQATAGLKLKLELLNASGETIGSATLTPAASGNGWKKETISFNAMDTALKGKFKLTFIGSGVIDLDMISLFPSDTWMNRPGGMRGDMVQLLADMKPGFLRFPGGCIVEGRDLASRYQWKKTIGPLDERQLIINRWNTEFAHRDEHYYRRPEWFLANAGRYDDYPGNGSKIFAGEYAAQSDHTVSIHNKNNMATAISEVAFMTGLERNAAVVHMASYAPLFAHDEAWQWTPDLIWVNNVSSYGTTDYYVQKLFSTNKGTDVVTALRNGQPLTGKDSLYVSAVIDKNTNVVIIKVVNASGESQTNSIKLDGVKKVNSTAMVTTLQSNDLNSVNSFIKPMNVAPEESSVNIKGNKINFTSMPYSFSVIIVNM